MFLKHSQIEPARITALLSAAEAAARRIPPAFPLGATVAVNPFLGQTTEDLGTAAARLARVAGISLTRNRRDYAVMIASGAISDDDLAAALIGSVSPVKPVDLALLRAKALAPSRPPVASVTLADLASSETGIDLPSVFAKTFGLWAAGHFDQGQAPWRPAPGQDAYAAWSGWASQDLTPEIARLGGFCAHVAAAPDTAERAILRASDRLGLTIPSAETVFHRLLMDMGGWAQHARWVLWQAELAGGTDTTLTDLLAIRLIWEEAILAGFPQLANPWADVIAAHAQPVTASPDQTIDVILQDAAERAEQRRMAKSLRRTIETDIRPTLQAAFCIDVRSEVFRRALEQQDAGIATIGFAGFFGLPIAHQAHGTDDTTAHLPVLLNAGITSDSHASPDQEQAARISARAVRAWGRFRQAAVSSFAFVEAAGPLYGAKLVGDALGLPKATGTTSPPPKFAPDLTVEAKVQTAAAVLTAMGLMQGHARVVLVLGHGAKVTNNPHESAYHCGACGGQTGEVSARLLALLLNDADTRAGLAGIGMPLPADTIFVAGLHETTTDRVILFPDMATPDHADDMASLRRWLDQAGAVSRGERAQRLPGAVPATLAHRALNWAEVRPEWGLAGCAAFIAAPRSVTAGADLAGRAFLHSYDWRTDQDFATLELILTAPVVVASWISLQYYGSSVAPDVFGGGNKLIHNVVGGIGVVEGNGGRLRPGLPWQTVHDGVRLAHDPLRLSVYIDAPQDAILDILRRHAGVRDLFDNGWMHLFALTDGAVAARYQAGLGWGAA